MMESVVNILHAIVFPGSSSQAPTAASDIQHQTREVAREIILYLARGESPRTDVGKHLCKISDESGSRVQEELDRCRVRLGVTTDNAIDVIQDVVRELLSEGSACNWGRVVVALTFAGMVARDLTQNDPNECFLENYSNSVGDGLFALVSDWMVEQGGWEKGFRVFGEQMFDKATFFTYLTTMVTFGVTIASVSYKAVS